MISPDQGKLKFSFDNFEKKINVPPLLLLFFLHDANSCLTVLCVLTCALCQGGTEINHRGEGLRCLASPSHFLTNILFAVVL